MKIVSIMLFALITAVSNVIAFKYIRHKKNDKEKLSFLEESDDTLYIEEKTSNSTKLMNKGNIEIFIIIAFTVMSVIVGIIVYDNTTSLLNFYRIILIFALTNIISITDFALRIIPNVFTAVLLCGGIIFHVVDILGANFENGKRMKLIFVYNIIAAIIVVFFLCVISAITRSGMGFGDIKYLGTLCFAGGITLLLISMTVSLMCGLIYGFLSVIIKKKKMKDTIPFGPFIMLGVLTCFFTGLM